MKAYGAVCNKIKTCMNNMTNLVLVENRYSRYNEIMHKRQKRRRGDFQ